MREAEGRRLEEELRRNLGLIQAEVDVIETRAPERLIRERNRLRERVAFLSDGVEVDEDRLAREIAYLAEKWDIAEEIVRLRSHVTFFLEQLGMREEAARPPNGRNGGREPRFGQGCGGVDGGQASGLHGPGDEPGGEHAGGQGQRRGNIGVGRGHQGGAGADPGAAGERRVSTSRRPVVLVGPSGAGKTTIAGRLVQGHPGTSRFRCRRPHGGHGPGSDREPTTTSFAGVSSRR